MSTLKYYIHVPECRALFVYYKYAYWITNYILHFHLQFQLRKNFMTNIIKLCKISETYVKNGEIVNFLCVLIRKNTCRQKYVTCKTKPSLNLNITLGKWIPNAELILPNQIALPL